MTISGANGMDYSGTAAASADINNDGIDDVITSSSWGDGPGEGRTACGEVYVMFYESLNETMDLSTDADIIIYGADSSDRCGQSLTTGDVNGDTIQDLIIGATSADGPSETRNACGEIYVIYGNTTLLSTYDLSVTSPDVIIYGPGESDSCGSSLAIGDINGDNIDDIITGAYWADGPGDAKLSCGEVHVVYGNLSLPSTIDLATQQNVTLYGIDASDFCGISVAAGDANNDGFDDIIMGAYGADGPGNARTSCGEVYIIYGNTTLPTTIDLGVNVDVKIYGTKMTTFGSYLGQAVAAGDVNLDNYDDLILGAIYDEVNTQRVGAVHVVYGASNLPATHDLMNIRANVTIYGETSMDRIGSKIVTGDMNADSFDDIIFSGPGADGPANTRSSCGEIYIVNGSSTLPSFINISTQDEDILIYGDEIADYTGNSLAIGKIDNDNVLDIVTGAIYADGPNNTKGSCGETYVILSSNEITPKLKPEFIGLTNGDGPGNKICYAKYKPYTFKVRVTDPNGYGDIDTVTLGLDYNGENLKCKWTRQTQQFQELSDPNDYIELSTTSKVKNLGLNSLMLYFNITFNWLYPDNEYHGVQIYSDSSSGLYGWLNKSTNIYQVENHVDFEGYLIVNGENQDDLDANSWLHGGEKLNWKGLKVVYFGTLDLYPPAEAGVMVMVWVPLGSSWEHSPAPGENIDIVTPIANSTQTDVQYKINITGIPAICAPSNYYFTFNIDADGVTYSNATPLEYHWQATRTPNCGIVISDPTTEVKVSTIQYRVSTDNGTSWPDGWTDANIAGGDNNTVTCNVTPTLENGVDNLIQWRAKDIVGNEFEASELSRVYVDVSHVIFNNATPRVNEWQPELEVECGITIFDNLSGINASSIEYRISTVGVNNYSAWRSADQISDANKIQCTVMATFKEGTNNYIQWRAMDVMGNGPYESMDYQIKILLNNPPETRLLSPENGTIFQTQTPELLWLGFDLDGDLPIYYNAYLSTEEPAVANLVTTALLLLDSQETRFKFETPLKDQTTYYWTVIPRDRLENGSCKSGVWHFEIDTAVEIPVAVLSNPYNGYNISTQTPTLSWALEYSNIESVSYNLFIDTKPEPETFCCVFDSTSYIPTLPLIRGKTYFWTVIPIANTTEGKIQGECSSGIWWFTIDRQAGRVYGVDLILDSENLVANQGSHIVTNITVTNTGNYDDIFVVSMGPVLIDAVITLEKLDTDLKLTQDESITLQLNITIDTDTDPRGYLIEFTAFSKGAKSELQDAEVTKVLQLRINKKEGGVGADDTEKDEGDLVLLAAAIIIIIILIIVIVFFVMKRKKKVEKAPEIQADIVYEPGKPTPTPALEIEKAPKIGEVFKPPVAIAPGIAKKKGVVPQLKPRAKKPQLRALSPKLKSVETDIGADTEVLEPEIESIPKISVLRIEGTPAIKKPPGQLPPDEPEPESRGPKVILPEASAKPPTKSSKGPKVILPDEPAD